MDKIIIKGLKVFAFHGVNPSEQEDGQVFILDIEARADLSRACRSDDIGDTVSYATIMKRASAVMLEEKNALIERAAQRVADTLLAEFPALESVRITLKKPDAPIMADFEYAAVEITRERND